MTVAMAAELSSITNDEFGELRILTIDEEPIFTTILFTLEKSLIKTTPKCIFIIL